MPFGVGFYTYPGSGSPAPLAEYGVAQEENFPWRTGKVLFLRMPFTRKAVVLIRWTGTQPFEQDEDGVRLSMRELDDWRQIVEDWEDVP